MHSYAKASELFILESEPQIPRHARSGREYRLRPRPRRAGAHSGMVTTYEQEETINRERGRQTADMPGGISPALMAPWRDERRSQVL